MWFRTARAHTTDWFGRLFQIPSFGATPSGFLNWHALTPRWGCFLRRCFKTFANPHYVQYLLKQLGAPDGKALERLAAYLMSCMPGCRTRMRAPTGSSDHDVVCSMEGFEVDFRSELGRYFVCECKDWESPANFTKWRNSAVCLIRLRPGLGYSFPAQVLPERSILPMLHWSS